MTFPRDACTRDAVTQTKLTRFIRAYSKTRRWPHAALRPYRNLKVEVERLDSTQVRLDIEVPVEDVNQALEETYQSLRDQVAIPGFRKGRVPVSILKSRYPEYINNEVVRHLVVSGYEEAIYAEHLTPLAQPVFSPPLKQLNVSENQPLTFSATVDIRPSLTLPRYDELTTDKAPVDVPREEVDAYIAQLQSQSATYEPLEDERPVQEKDCVRLDWECFINGEYVEAESQQDVDVELGAGIFHEKLEEALLGMELGDTKTVAISFEANHRSPVLAGNTAHYELTLHAITQKLLPELDDEFAKDLGYENFPQLYGVIWNNLVEEERSRQVDRQRAELLEQLIEQTDITVPETLVQQALQNLQRQFAAENAQKAAAGEPVSTENAGLPTHLRPDVIKQIKQAWIFNAIAEREGIHITDDELELELRRAAEHQNRDAQVYANLLKSNNRLEDFRSQLQNEKIYQFLIQRASTRQSLIIT